jgi:GT2 family glycosyltransferase
MRKKFYSFSSTDETELNSEDWYLSQKNYVAIVIPVRDRPDLLTRVLAALTVQDVGVENFEVLVCDDGSAMDPKPVVESFLRAIPNLKILGQKARGPAAARNLGIREAKAPIIIFLDSDTLPDPAMVRHLATALEQNQDWVGAEAKIESLATKGNPLWDGPICQNGGRYHTAAIAYRRDALMLAGGLDETFTLPACEDVELAMRILSRGTIGFVPEAVVYHPSRRVNLGLHWRWRRYWKYEMVLAKRYGILGFPEHSAGRFPRLRVALAAVVTLPGGRLLDACKHLRRNIGEAFRASLYALFDVLCGLTALPEIIFSPIPPRKNFLENLNQQI